MTIPAIGQQRERLALLALLRRRKTGWADLARRVQDANSALRVAEDEGLLGGTLFDEGDTWEADLAAAEHAVKDWDSHGLRLVTVLDPDYPRRLRDVKQMPPFLFIRGSFDDRDQAGVAIVGSRRASARSLEAAAEMATDLARAGHVVISGLAAGIDTAAHTAALRAGGRTVAVVGTGLERSYPAENAALQARIATEGLLISRFWPEGPPTKISFPLRNEVMSGWARATCVVQADMKSGARMQARVALQQGRQLFLYRDMQAEEWAVKYVQEGRARFVDSARDMV